MGRPSISKAKEQRVLTRKYFDHIKHFDFPHSIKFIGDNLFPVIKNNRVLFIRTELKVDTSYSENASLNENYFKNLIGEAIIMNCLIVLKFVEIKPQEFITHYETTDFGKLTNDEFVKEKNKFSRRLQSTKVGERIKKSSQIVVSRELTIHNSYEEFISNVLDAIRINKDVMCQYFNITKDVENKILNDDKSVSDVSDVIKFILCEFNKFSEKYKKNNNCLLSLFELTHTKINKTTNGTTQGE